MEDSMNQIVENEQICINCKGTGKKVSVLRILFSPIVIIIGIIVIVFALNIDGKLGFIISIASIGIFSVAFAWKKACPACSGKGRIVIKTRYSNE